MAAPTEGAQREPPQPHKGLGFDYSVLMRIAVAAYIAHFKLAGSIKEPDLKKLDGYVRRTLGQTVRNPDVRRLGLCEPLWVLVFEAISAAIPSLTSRCFVRAANLPRRNPGEDPANAGASSVAHTTASALPGAQDTVSGPLIISNMTSLLADLERLIDLLGVARNALACGDGELTERAQKYAADADVHRAVCRLISICVRVAARGFENGSGAGAAAAATVDGQPVGPNPADEEKWQIIVSKYKLALVTGLQLLNNLVSKNERKKLMLWVELFDSSCGTIFPNGSTDAPTKQKGRPPSFDPKQIETGFLRSDLDKAALDETAAIQNLVDEGSPKTDGVKRNGNPSPFLQFMSTVGQSIRKELADNGGGQGCGTNVAEKVVTALELVTECRRRWQAMSEEQRAEWTMAAERGTEWTFAGPLNDRSEDLSPAERFAITTQAVIEGQKKSIPHLYGNSSDEPIPPAKEDFRVTYSSEYGASILRRGKEDLLDRLEPLEPRDQIKPTQSEKASEGEKDSTRDASVVVETEQTLPQQRSDEDDYGTESEGDDEEDDYIHSGDDGRGLLTDVPLILGPAEIEVLPVLIMGGIFRNPSSETSHPSRQQLDEQDPLSRIGENLYRVRCHLLLAQENGRNLLRELLIFVAAWDLREEELYFRVMIKIMEAILDNGLMPFAYHAFRENKDIISPAQAVIMKLLANIFRSRQLADGEARDTVTTSAAKDFNSPPEPTPLGFYPSRVDVRMASFLFTEFRQRIVPQTCALIFLQGRVHARRADPQEFPLNLWDMERMYEGLYQYLEFFAVLTEHPVWKDMMADWDLCSEIVTLLKELDSAIPKASAMSASTRQQQQGREVQVPLPSPSPPPPPPPPPAQASSQPPPVAVERPYDLTEPPISQASSQPAPSGDKSNQFSPSGVADVDPWTDEPQDEPADFEWRNLKKLAVLVLSSLAWKSKKVQDQVRDHKGIEVVLRCCAHDEFNPYMREHAVMCLRFLIEGNRANIELVSALKDRAKGKTSPTTDRVAGDVRGSSDERDSGARSLPEVPPEVLDQHGYETYVDDEGHIALKRRDKRTTPTHLSTSPATQPT